MIEVRIRNVAGCERADLTLEPGKIALIGGWNFAGKTSLIQALGAGITGNGMIRTIGAKKDAGELVREGTSKGYVIVQTDEGSATVTWPECSYKTDGRPPVENAYACGVSHLARISDPAERAALLVELLGASPTKDDLTAFLADAKLKPETIDVLWKKISTQGWDATYDELRKRGTKLKGGWEQITGEKWGEKKADGWMPKDFDHDIRRNEENYVQDLEDAKRKLEAAIAGEAVSAEKIAQLEKESADGREAQKEANRLKGHIDSLMAELEKTVADREKLPPALTTEGQPPCPHCGKSLRIVQTSPGVHKLEKGVEEKIDDAELKKRRLAIASADGHISNLKGKIADAQRDLTKALALVQRGAQAETDLVAAKERSGDVDVLGARARFTYAESNLRLYRQMIEAADAHAGVMRNLMMIDACAPDGVRLNVLSEKLQPFNKRLAAFANIIGIKPIRVDDDMTVRLGERRYGLLSESEQFLTDIILQAGLAESAKCNLLLVDGAEVLHPKLRSGFLLLLRELGRPAVVTMMVRDLETLPKLREFKVGAVYWMEGGVLSPTER